MAEHLDAHAFALYLDGRGTSAQRAEWDEHLSACGECRKELSETRLIIDTVPARRRTFVVPLAAAAALFFIWIGTLSWQSPEPVTRDPETSYSAAAPAPIAPLGTVTDVRRLVWSRVTGATRYRVTLFTDEGQAAWQGITSDTFAALPDTVRLPRATPQYWQVKAQTEFGRWIESELVTFTISPTVSRR